MSLFFRSVKDDQIKLWRLVRSRPDTCRSYVDICHHLSVPGGCYMRLSCHFAHSNIESMFWEMDIGQTLNLNAFLNQQRLLWHDHLKKLVRLLFWKMQKALVILSKE